MIEILQAIFLGIIEGLTEFLPISSTGHILLAQHYMGYKDTAEVFTVVVQLGALGAVLLHYKNDLRLKAKGLIKKDKKSLKFWKIWIIATLPAALAGLLLKDLLSGFSNPQIIAVALIIGGVLMWLVENFYKIQVSTTKPKLEDISCRSAFLVGCYQILALIPGVSRSGATIMGGLLSGLDRVTATTFSFYLSIPILFLAGAYKLISGYDNISTISGGGVALLAGTVASFISAFIVIGWLLKYISKHNFKIFAYYRIALGIILLLAMNS